MGDRRAYILLLLLILLVVPVSAELAKNPGRIPDRVNIPPVRIPENTTEINNTEINITISINETNNISINTTEINNTEINTTTNQTTDVNETHINITPVINTTINISDNETSDLGRSVPTPLKTSHIYANGKIATIEDDDSVQYVVTDHLSSTSKTLDSTGNVIDNIEYYAFGQDKIVSEEDYKYTGKQQDTETGLYYYGARYYEPVIGRFLAADTNKGDITNPQSTNRYTYTANNPIKYVDPTGNEFYFSNNFVQLLKKDAAQKAFDKLANVDYVYEMMEDPNVLIRLQFYDYKDWQKKINEQGFDPDCGATSSIMDEKGLEELNKIDGKNYEKGYSIDFGTNFGSIFDENTGSLLSNRDIWNLDRFVENYFIRLGAEEFAHAYIRYKGWDKDFPKDIYKEKSEYYACNIALKALKNLKNTYPELKRDPDGDYSIDKDIAILEKRIKKYETAIQEYENKNTQNAKK